MSVDEYFDRQGRFIPAKLANEILAETVDHYLVTPITDKGGDIVWVYHHNLGIFKPDGIAYVEQQARERLEKRCKRGHIGEVVKLVQVGSYTDRELFEEAPGVIVVQNGTIHLDSGELKGHHSIHNAKSRLPVKYDPKATCPAILKFLSEVIPGDIATFQEWMGYHLIKDYRWALIMMLVGDGENGKSILLRLMREFLGHENCSDMDLYRLTASRFAAAQLDGRLANIAPDVGADELKRTGILKALTGNDYITVEKKFQQPFSLRNTAKLSFSMNKVPQSPDHSRAWHRRPLVMKCPNKFVGDDCDPRIFEKITTPTELSGLLNWALEGRRRLISQGHFTDNKTAEEKQALYEELSDDVTAFIRNCVDIETDGIISKDQLYNSYYGFCKAKGFSPILKQTFTKELKPRLPNLKEGRRKTLEDPTRKMCWLGISLKCQGCQGCQGSISHATERTYLGGGNITLDTSDTPDARVLPEAISSENEPQLPGLLEEKAQNEPFKPNDYGEFEKRRQEHFNKMVDDPIFNVPQNFVNDALDFLEHKGGSVGRILVYQEMKRRGHLLKEVNSWLVDMKTAELITLSEDTVGLPKERLK